MFHSWAFLLYQCRHPHHPYPYHVNFFSNYHLLFTFLSFYDLLPSLVLHALVPLSLVPLSWVLHALALELVVEEVVVEVVGEEVPQLTLVDRDVLPSLVLHDVLHDALV